MVVVNAWTLNEQLHAGAHINDVPSRASAHKNVHNGSGEIGQVRATPQRERASTHRFHSDCATDGWCKQRSHRQQERSSFFKQPAWCNESQRTCTRTSSMNHSRNGPRDRTFEYQAKRFPENRRGNNTGRGESYAAREI